MANDKDYLSQEEIDALLSQSTNQTDPDSNSSTVPDVNNYLSGLEQDALGEIGNITFGNAATVLSTLLGKKVDITTPQVSTISKVQLKDEFPKPHVAIHVNYVEGFDGINLLVIKTHDARIIADLMMGGTGEVEDGDLSELHISAVQEAMNQMMGSSATSMSTIFNRFVNISPPGIDILDFTGGNQELNKFPLDDVFIKVAFRLSISGLIDSSIMQLLPISFAKEMIGLLIGTEEMEENSTSQPDAVATEATSSPSQGTAPPTDPPPIPTSVPTETPGPTGTFSEPTEGRGGMVTRNVNVQTAKFSALEANNHSKIEADHINLNLLLDIPLKVSVELGRTQKKVKDILELSQGSIIELDKLAGEPVDILVNNKFVAKGEVVVIDENFGVRVTDIVNQWERIEKIQ